MSEASTLSLFELMQMTAYLGTILGGPAANRVTPNMPKICFQPKPELLLT